MAFNNFINDAVKDLQAKAEATVQSEAQKLLNSEQFSKLNGLLGNPKKATEDPGIPNAAGERDPQKVLDRIKLLEKNQTNYSTSIMQRGLSISKISSTDNNKKYPYSLIIAEAQTSKDKSDNNNIIGYKFQAEFTFPINPQELTISTPFAINTTVTSRGILEEHNGAPLRMISASGTTGILYTRDVAIKQDQTVAQSVFGSTLTAIDNLKASLSVLTNGTTQGQNQSTDADFTAANYSGYFQMHLLRAFLELYSEIKKTKSTGSADNSRSYRLILANRKDTAYYLITPKVFTIRKSAASPMEATYQFQAVAWGTINGDNITKNEDTRKGILVNNLNDYQIAIDKIRQARNAIANVKNLITSVKNDVENNIFGPINNVILALSEAASIPQQIADFPLQLRADFLGTVVQNANSLRDQLQSLPTFLDYSKNVMASLSGENTSDIKKATLINGVTVLSSTVPGTNKTFDQAISGVTIQSLPLTYAQQNAINESVNTALEIDNNDINKLIENINDLTLSVEPFAEEQGVDSPYWDVLYSCNEITNHLYSFLSSDTFNPEPANNLIQDYYINAAQENNVNLQSHVGKIEVPFPYGQTLEWLSQVYLGDASRWMEIVSANNLKAPYIDEVGVTLDFLTNGSDRQINVNSISNMYVGQFAWIYSNSIAINRRKIISLQKISDNNYIVTVDGKADLNNYQVSNGAKIKVYLPNTVNSQKTIYIPVDTSSSLEQISTSLLGKLDITEELLDMSYVDMALSPEGDVMLQPDGTTNLSYGVANLIQALIIKFKVVAGRLLLHPEFGGGIEVGSAESEFSVDVLRDSIIKTVQSDPRFKSVYNLVITQDSGAIQVSMTVETANNYILPIGFSIN